MKTQSNLVTTIEIKDRQGRVVATKEVVTYAGLLNRAHQEGLKEIETKLLQAPSADNEMTAISMAKVVTEKGVFVEVGDANPGNVNSTIIPHIIRMAFTRAKARALRDAVNVGVIALEELIDDFGSGAVDNGNGNGASAATAAASGSSGDDSNGNRTSQAPAPDPMTESQRRYLFRLLAERGVNGEESHDYLKRAFGVESLKDASKADASTLIDHVLNVGLEGVPT